MKLTATAIIALVTFTSIRAAADPELATVLVLAPAGAGSGAVLYSDGHTSLVMTNKHVCPNGDRPIQVRAQGKLYPAEWLGADSESDLAVLRVKADLPALTLAENEPAKGDRLRLFGYGGLPKSGVSIGRDGSHYSGSGDAFFVSLLPKGGDSGAPLINDSGEVAGIVWGTREQGNRVGIAVPLADVRRVLGTYTGTR